MGGVRTDSGEAGRGVRPRWLGANSQLSGARLGQIIRGLGFVCSAVAWAVVVWVWPGLHLGNDGGSRSAQPAVLIAVASIQAAVVVAGLAVGAIVLQVMARYSWAVVRSVLPGWLAPVLAIVVGGGVVLPLWVAFAPTGRLSTAAFAAFGWSLLAIGVTVWEAARRMNPPSLSAEARRRALRVLSRDHRGGRASDVAAEVLGQLAAGAELPYQEGLRMVGTYTLVLADRAREGSHGEVGLAVRALGERATSVESVALASSVVRALWVLGLDQAAHPCVFDEAHKALTAIAGDARRRGQRELATDALDALAGMTARRVSRALPAVGSRTPPKPRIPPPPPRRSDDGFFPRPVYPSSLPTGVDQEPVVPAGSRASRRDLLNRFVWDFAADSDMPAGDLAATLAAGLMRPADTGGSTGACGHGPSAWWDEYELLDETVDALVALLPSPQPASTSWPSGWQGHGAFDGDIQRLADLADCLYRQGKHVPVDLVEDALEMIGVRLRAEQPPATDLPATRTGWRYPPMRSEEGGIARVTADCLSRLMSSAFDAGFDRRALSTGLRILASVTASAQQGDRDATVAYANALIRFTLDTSRHGLEAQSQAGSQRMQVVLIGLISEIDQLLDAVRRQKGQNPEICQAVEELTTALTWNTPRARMYAVPVAMLQARLVAAGWPVSLPSGQRRMSELNEPETPPPARPLPDELVSEVQTMLTDSLPHDHARLTAAAVITLWAHAACLVQNGSADEARRISAFLTGQLRVRDKRYAQMPAPLAAPGEEQIPGYQPLDSHLRRIISAAARWCAKANLAVTPTIPHAAGPPTCYAIARWLVSQPDTSDWTYQGTEDAAETHLVIAEMPDGSRRVLRDQDLRTGDLRWGYTGTGAHDLSSVLLADILTGHRECPDCFGVIALAADMITCKSCYNTGLRSGTRRAEYDLLIKVIENLPEEFERTRLQFLCAITGKQMADSDISAARRTIRDAKSSIVGRLARIRHT
jgi:hypothetical protein